MTELESAIRAAAGLVAVVNPFGALPVYLVLTRRLGPRERARTARRVGIAVAVALLAAGLAGGLVLGLLGIGMPAFRTAGGLFLLVLAVPMLRGEDAPPGTRDGAGEEDARAAAVVPLAVPLLAGPGAISTVILYAKALPPGSGGWTLGAGVLAAGLASWIALRAAAPLERFLGTGGIRIATRLMGLLLAALAVEMVAKGLAALLPGLAGS